MGAFDPDAFSTQAFDEDAFSFSSSPSPPSTLSDLIRHRRKVKAAIAWRRV